MSLAVVTSNWKHWRNCRRGAVVLALCVLAAGTLPAVAQNITGVSQEDLDGDGQPDVTTLTTRLLSEGDVIRVYDGDGDMQASSDWRTATDFDSDTWVFDVGNDSFPQLVIQFSRTDDGLRADLFADLNADGNVDIVQDGKQITVVEAGVVYPVVSTAVLGDWYLPDGQLNWNVRFTTDGVFIFDTDELPAGIETLNLIRDLWLPFLQYDSQPDMEFSFHDDDMNGIPEYMLWRLLSETPANVGALRARVWSNAGQSVPSQPAENAIWPILVASGDEVFGGPGYFDTPPFIGIDWSTARLSPPQFHGYPIEAGFHVHNLNYFNLHEVNYANFEIGQDYYDLADDNDDLPELHIRHRYYGPNDPLAWDVRTPISEVRYSWNQTNAPDLGWDYALGLVNTQEVTAQVNLPDFSYRAIPYNDLPSWVVNSSWDLSTFIAPEAARYLSTEGVYEWGPVETTGQLAGEPQSPEAAANVDFQNSLMSRYFAGEEVTVDMRRTFNEQLTNGLRGEVRYSKSGSPLVYLSPVDHKLHLLHADFGLWNFDGNSRMRYENLNGDALIDSWSVQVGDAITAQLVQAPNYLIYADERGVVVRRTAVPGAAFVTRPPTTPEEWQALGAQIDANRTELGRADLKAMFDQFAGETWTYPGAALQNVRLTQSGAQFDMTAPSASSEGTVASYIVLDGAMPVVRPQTPPQIQMEFEPVGPLGDKAIQLVPLDVGFTVTNTGAQDAYGVQLEMRSSSEDTPAQVVNSAVIDLAAGAQERLWFTWTPPEAGDWSLTLDLEDAPESQVDGSAPLAVKTVQAAGSARPDWEEMASLDDELPFGGMLVVIMVASLALSIFALAFLILRNQAQRDS